MFAKSVKIVGLLPKKNKDGTPSEYKTVFCTGPVGESGIGTATYSFSAKGDFKLGADVKIVFVEKTLATGQVIKSWEIVNF